MHRAGQRAARPPDPQRTTLWRNVDRWSEARTPPALIDSRRWCEN